MPPLKRLAVLAVLCLPLAACGFRPLYGTDGVESRVAQQMADIEIANIPDRDGQYLRNILIDRLHLQGRPADARYLVSFTPVRKDVIDFAVQKDATYTRARVELYTTMTLTDRRTGETVLTRDLRAAGSYNQLDNQFATFVSKESMTDHLLAELGDSAVTALGLYLHGNPTGAGW